MYRRSAAAVATGLALVMGAASACSSGDGRNGLEKKTPTEVLASAKTALTSAKSVHIAGTTADAGGSAPMTIDLRFVGGRGSVGKLTEGARSVDLVRVGNDIYVRGAGDLVGVETTGAGDRYLKISATEPENAALAQITDLGKFANNLLKPTGKLGPTVDQTVLGGAKTVVLTDTDATEGGKLYIANTGAARPLEIEGAGSDTGNKLTFSDYDGDVPLSTPANALTGPLLNGEEKKAGAEVIADARAALKTARTVHVHGHASGDSGTDQVQIDMRYVNGKGATGTIVSGGKKVEIIRIGQIIYVKGGADLFGSEAASAIGNRYLRTSVTNADTKKVAEFTDLTKFSDGAFGVNTAGEQFTVSRSTLDGSPVVVVSDPPGAHAGALTVANTGSPYPLKIASIGGGSDEILFSEYDETVNLAAPTNVINLPGSS